MNYVIRRDDGTDVTLVPVSDSTDKGVRTLIYRELSTSKPVLACITLTLAVEKFKSGVLKLTRKLEVPVMKIIPAGAVNADGRVAAPDVSHVDTDIRVRLHSPLTTATERADSLKMANYVDCSGHATAGSFLSPASTTANTYRDASSAYRFVYGDVNLVWTL